MYPHINDGIEIHFIQSGKYHWVVEGNEIELFPDDLSITTPWQLNGSPYGKMDIGEITWIVLKPFDYSFNRPLNLGSWSGLPDNFQQNLGAMLTHENIVVLRKAKTLKKYFTELKNELSSQQKGYEIVVRNIVESLLVDLYRHLSLRRQKTIKDDNLIESLTELISSDLRKKWYVDDLAYQFCMGKTKFTDEVKKLTGYPPNSFIIDIRIKMAIKLLKTEKTSLSDIAYTCGFSSLQHFISTFSNRIGVGPGKYRKNVHAVS